MPGNSDGWMGSLVLVIDDDPAVCDVMTRYLSQEGFLVETAATGEDGYRVAQEIRPDVIILDVQMPGMDGWGVLEVLKADPALAAIPVIMLTILEDKERAFRLGAADYLVKPIDQVRMTQLLKKYQPMSHDSAIVDDAYSH